MSTEFETSIEIWKLHYMEAITYLCRCVHLQQVQAHTHIHMTQEC